VVYKKIAVEGIETPTSFGGIGENVSKTPENRFYYLFSLRAFNRFLYILAKKHISNCAYDMKNIFCLFERPLKIQKNGVFLLDVCLFVFVFLLCKLDP